MRIDVPQKLLLELARLPLDEQRDWLSKCRPEDLLAIDALFDGWAANGQIAPSEDGWRVWLMLAGRGFGKTRAGAEWIHALALTGKVRIALVGATIDDARSVMVEGVAGVLTVARRQRVKIKWEPSLGRLSWPRGSVAQLFSGDNADGLRGPEHDFAWCPAGARPGRCRGGRGTPTQCAARGTGAGGLLHHRCGTEWSMGREGEQPCGLH